MLPKYDPCGKVCTLQTSHKVLSENPSINYPQKQFTVHTEQKPFKCKTCMRLSGKNSAFMSHLKTHQSGKMLKCPECEKEFKYTSGFAAHIWKSHHQNIFKCNLCGKEFNELSKIKRHCMAHSEEKPYECEQCNKQFDLRASLIKHKQIDVTPPILNLPKGICICKPTNNEIPIFFKNEEMIQVSDYSVIKNIKLERKIIPKIDPCDKVCTLQTSHNALSENPSINYPQKQFTVHTEQKPFKCKTCMRLSGKNSAFMSHLKTHLSGKMLKCPECEKEFKYTSGFAAHIWKSHYQNIFKCNLCGKEFNELSKIKRHCMAHSEKNLFKCEPGNKQFDLGASLMKHEQIETPSIPVLAKGICGGKQTNNGIPIFFINKEMLQVSDYSVIKNNKLERKILHKFDPCGKLCIQQSHKVLAKHPSVNNTQKQFTVHSEQKPFKCKTCMRLSGKNSAFLSHLKTHQSGMMLKCPECEKEFKFTSGFAAHIWKFHYQNIFKCNLCGKELNELIKIKRHCRAHSKEKPFKCELCNMRFGHRGLLMKHVQIHETPPISNCPICRKQYKNYRDFLDHKYRCKK